MDRMGKGLCHGVLLALMVALLAAGGCSGKDDVPGEKPATKGDGCSLGIVRIFG